jgi:thiol-disulfide isomerase/thioredoxin
VVLREQVVTTMPGRTAQVQRSPGGPRALLLRTGDVIPSEVTKIDETGVTFKTSMSDSTFVPHDKVKAVELAPATVATVRLSVPKRDRLLTLPRMQKDTPPAHLIRSKNGDYLRGRVVGLDAKTLKVEVRLETREIPRDRVARIIWLHPDETDPSKSPPKDPAEADKTRVQALRSDGIRLTFHAQRVADQTVTGESEVLGSCRVKLDDVDQLLFGGAIEKAAAQLAYQRWKLTNAPEPKIPDAEGGGSSGTESPLVGKPAPDFALTLLDGKPFRLSESKGSVVVLDFWATWCGPCLQAMPQVEKVANELKDKGVKLVAVNLQETPEQIKPTMERHKLGMTVALDRDGVVAEKYKANAIPQTVIIDRDGNVARLFVGSSPHLEDTLREALNAVLEGKDPKDPAN